MAAELSAVAFFAPIAAFFLVTLVVFAVLGLTKILGESKWLNIIVALIVAIIFISAAGVRAVVQTIIPWFAVFFICLFLMLLVIGFMGKDAVNIFTKPIGIIFLIVFGLVFVVSIFSVFSNYLPGPNYGNGVNETALYFTDWLYTPSIWGAIVLVVVGIIVSWILIKAK